MKKIAALSAICVVIAACFILLFANPERLVPNDPAGKTTYYAQIAGQGVADGNGRTSYELEGYTKDGKKKAISFSTGKPLQEGTYVKLYHAWLRGVTYYEVIAGELIPVKAKEKVVDVPKEKAVLAKPLRFPA